MSVSRSYRVFGAFCCCAALACLRPPERAPAPPDPPPSAVTPAAQAAPMAPAAPAAPTAPQQPLDDPNSCVDSASEVEKLVERANVSREASEALRVETERRITESLDELRSCRTGPAGASEVIVEVLIAPDGATRAGVLGTSLSECGVVECIREKLTGLQVAPPSDDTRTFQWLLSMAESGPARLEPASPNHPWFGKSPASSASCLETARGREVSGRLPPEVIKQIVRGNYGTFRKCYEAGLGRYAKLEGRVTVRFVIERDGAVSNAVVGDSTLPDCQVARCIRDGFKALRFPKPEGGIVTVSYPIMLQPG